MPTKAFEEFAASRPINNSNTKTTAGANSSRPSAIPPAGTSQPASSTAQPAKNTSSKAGTSQITAPMTPGFAALAEQRGIPKPATRQQTQSSGTESRPLTGSTRTAGTTKPANSWASFIGDDDEDADGVDEIPGRLQLGMQGSTAAPDNSARREELQRELQQIQTYEGYIMDPDEANRSAARKREIQDELAAINAAAAPTVTDWAGRSDLIRELEDIDTNSGYITNEQEANAAAARRAEVIAELEAGDTAAGNELESYDEANRGRQILSGSTTNYLAGLANHFGTVLAALYEGVDTNPYAGWATDEVSAANIGYEHDEGKLDDYAFIQQGADTLEATADQLGEYATRDLGKAKAGLSQFGQAGVDIATNIIQMGYDLALGKLLGGHSLIPMFVRSSGSASQEARQNGATTSQQLLYGIAKGGIEVATEKIFDGVAKIYGAGAADDITEEVIRRLANTPTGRTMLRVLIGAGGEGAEEVISDLLSPFADMLYKDKSLRELFREIDPAEVVYDFLIGAAIGGMGGATNIITGDNAQANAKLDMVDAGVGSNANMAENAWDVLTGRQTAEQVRQREQQARGRLGLGNALDSATNAELAQLRDLAGQALELEELDEQTKAQLRILQTAADLELQNRETDRVQGGMTNVENQTQEVEGVLGQEETVSPAGEAPRAGGPESNTGTEAAAGSPTSEPEDRRPQPAGSQERYAGAGAGRESGSMGGSPAERSRGAAEQRRVAVARQSAGNALWERGEVNLQSAQELGISTGSDTQDLKVFPETSYDEEMQTVSQRVAYETGLPVTFVSGLIHTRNNDGTYGRRRAVITTTGIIIQADNPNVSVTQLAEHEIFHAWQRADPELRTAARDKILQTYSREEFARVLEGYIKSHRGIIDVNENTDPDTMEQAALDLIEEILADAHADMNAFGLGAYRFREAVDRTVEERRGMQEQNRSGERETRGPPERFSYGGETAWEGDFAALDVAEEMEQEGTDPETIRQDTGWFRGMDGKWRFEIDDSAMELRGDYRDFLDNQHTERGMRLSELIYHSSLFNQYPQLASIDVAFDIPETSDTYGSWSGSWGGAQHISLNQKLLADGMEGELLDTLIHEMQHAIQDTEGFASGSNPRYWERQLKEGYDGRTRAEREASREAWERYNQIREEDPEFFEEAADLMLSTPDSPRGAIDWDTFEQLEPDPPEWQEFDARRDALEEKYGEEKMFNFMDLYHEVKSKETTRRSNYELYRKTAGEIEARDATNRRGMNTEQRKAKRPDIDQEDVVFARSRETGYALRDKKIPTREELEAKEDIPVVDIREETSGSFKEQRDAFLNSEEAQALYSEPALNRDTNEPLFIIPKSITHTFRNAGQENILLAKHLREIAENAILTHGEPSRSAPDDHTTGVYKFFGAVRTADGVQPVKLTVKEYSVEGQDIPKAVLDYVGDIQEGDAYAPIYDGKVLVLEDIEKETSSSAPSSTRNNSEPDKHPSVSTISVKDLLDLVKGEDTKYIPQREASGSTRFSTDDSEIPGAILGDEDETFVNDTDPVKFRWAIVPLESLVVSNDTSGSVNPAYPAELQPRNRSRAASQMQMQKISQNINPRQLEDSANAQNGAPIIRADGVVIGGNIRSMALADAYEKGRADSYREYIRDRAARKFGLDASNLPERPVLVRIAEDVSDWAQLARDLNTSTIATYSATERAMADAARMGSRIMSLLSPDEDGNINTTANRDFIQSFIANVVPDNERGAAITGSGLLSQDGLERAEYAIFAAAYHDADLMQRMGESLDNDMKNVTNGLLDIAPKVMQTQAAVDAGQMYDTRATENLLEAVRLYTEAKRAGQTVEERTANQSLTDNFSDEIIYTARLIEKFKRSAKQIRTFFNGLYDEIESYGDPNQINLFGEDEDHSYRNALEGAIKRYERATDTQLPALGQWGAGWYEATDRGNETKAAEPVHESTDSSGGESSSGGRVEEPVPWDASPLPPPPTTAPANETETEQAESSARQRDLQRMAKRREKDKAKQRRQQPPKFQRHPEYNPLKEFEGTENPVKEYIKAAQARAAAAKAERLMQADKRNFTATPALQHLGVHIQNSVGIYAHVDQLLARERAAYQLRKTIRQREAKLNATAKEKAFAAGIAAGTYTAEDVPANMSRAKVEELADYYWAEKAVASDMIAQRRKDINLGLDDQMDELLKDSDLYKVPPAIVMNYRTPERLCKTIWGDEHGQAIYDAIFRPVSINEAEKTRFINRMFDEVRTFEGSDGKRSELNKEERVLTQQVLEGRAVQELVASMEMHEAVESAAQNILNGEDTSDAAREFSLTEEERGIAEQYARWLQTQAIYDSGDFDTVKIDNAVKKYSEMYDNMYDAINDFLVAHGYDPIGFIKGYAPHMQMNEDLNLFAGYLDRLGFNTNVTRLPTSIAGRTADLKPNKRWNPYFLQRTGDMTDFDIAKGFESYVNYLSDVLYHTDDIMRIRAMSRYYRRTFAPDEIHETLDWVHHNENASLEVKTDMLKDRGIIARDSDLAPRDVQSIFDEWVDKQYESVENMTKYSDYVSYLDNYANLLAGKQSTIDRGAEALLGRESLTWGNKLVNSFQRTQVAGSFSSALNQSAQLPQIRAELGAKYTRKAVADFMSGAARKGAWAQESDFLTGKRGVDMLVTDAFDMVMEKAFAPATFVDGLMSTIAVRGKYLQQIDAGKSHAEAMKAADEFGRKIMGSRVKGEKPVAFNSKRPVVQMLNMFQIEALNSWEHLSQDLPEDFRRIEKQSGSKAAAGALASVIVKMLLSAFLLNRLGEEVYGGTPAPFDLLGLSTNFIASGYGLTTNQYLKTVIDNGLERLTGDRLLGTDPDAMRDSFQWEDAFEDVGYNISNDIPFFRNIAGLMGWGDQTLPLPLMGAGKDLKYLFSDIKSDIAEGHLSAETSMDLLRIMNQALPGGRQLTKTAEGLQLMGQGGRYVNGRLYYPVENNLGNWIKALLFGRSSLSESDAYYAGDDSSLSQKQTEMYRELVRDGADGLTLYRAIQDYKAIAGDDALGSYEKGRQEREAITNADLTDEQRLALYRGMSTNNEGRAEDFEEIMDTGLTWADTVKAYDKWAELNANEEMSKTEKAEAYAAWVERQEYDDEERASVRDHFKFWQSIPIESTKVDKFAGAGMEIDAAEQLSETLRNLQPLPGKTSVTDLQRYQAIADSGLSVEDQWTAIIAQTNPSYTSTLDKIQIYRQQGIAPSVWTASKEAMYAADDAGNNNDSTDQAEARAALDGMNIPDWQKAILWQTANKSWKPNKNPYDREVGQAIYDQMHGGAAAGSQAHGGLTLGMWGQNSGSYAPQSDTTPASTGLTLGNWG